MLTLYSCWAEITKTIFIIYSNSSSSSFSKNAKCSLVTAPQMWIFSDFHRHIWYDQSASPVLVQHYIANKNFIQVGSHMMPYALERRDNDEQIKREKEGKMNMTGGESWNNTHTHKTLCCFKTFIRKEESLHAVGRHIPCICYNALFLLWCKQPWLSHLLFPYLHLSLSICDSLPLIKYSQLVPLNIHCAALLRLSALRQSASSECTRSPPKAWKHRYTLTHTLSACMACDVAAL